MDKETLSHYGWIVILVLILSVMLALASPLGSFVADGFKATYAGFGFTNDSALSIVDTITGGPDAKPALNPSGTVPEDGKYTTADGTVYNPGDKMPETATTGDKYTYGDYEYAYNMKSSGYCHWTVNETQSGWGVDTIDNAKTEYGEILRTINNQPITNLSNTFRNCNKFSVAPEIPKTVTNVEYAFMNCDRLLVAPELPQNITSLYYTFANCTDLHTAPPALPNGITNMQYAFCCTSLTTAPNTPETVIDMHCAYYKCYQLKTAPNVPANVITLTSTFAHCTSLEGIIVIDATPSSYTSCFDLESEGKDIILTGKSNILGKIAETKGTKYRNNTDVRHSLGQITNGDYHISGDYTYVYYDAYNGWRVHINTYKTTKNETKYNEILTEIEDKPITSLNHTFAYCANLKIAPEIPYGVKDMNQAFFKTAITMAPVIPNGVEDMSYAFSYCTNLIATPIIPESVTNMEYIFNGCTSLIDINQFSIPSGVTSLHSAFSNCTSLTEAPNIPETATYLYRTFANCTSLITAPKIHKNATQISNIFENCTSMSGTVVIDTNVSTSTKCFEGVDFVTQNITLSGASKYLDTYGATGINYCKTCNGTCQNNH